MTVEEPKITDAESAAESTEAETATPDVAAQELAPAEATPAEEARADEPAAVAETEVAMQAPADGTAAEDDTIEPPAASSADLIEADTEGTATPEAEVGAAVPDGKTGGESPVHAAVEAAEFEYAPPAAEAHEVDDRPEPTTMAELLAEQSGDIPSLKHGDVVEGKIVRIDKDEILVDVGAKSEGVVSNRELYGRNTESQPELIVGDTVLVYVLQPESTDGHAVLSLRRAGLERKWRSMQEQFDEGVIIDAPVIDHNKGGLIVDCGIRGFVPISQIVDFPRRPQNDQPRDAAQEIAEKLQPYVGRKLRLKILEVNRKANRLILSEKVALYEERREKRDELFSSLETGQKVVGTVRSIAPFGIFVDLGGIDGLVHKSELSWNKVNNPEGAYQVGDEVEAEVIDINHERGRISLSIRRLLADPWQSTVADLNVGDITEGTVTKIVNFGAFVRVKDGLEGLIHISELSHQRVAHPGDVVHEGQTLQLKIISLDSERHRLGLSLKQAEEAPERPARERRPRSQPAGFDQAQAIQEPEGGIDNTLAAAFAQVRLQIAEQDAADSGAVEVAAEAVEVEAIAEAVEAEAVIEAADAIETAALAEEAADLEGAMEAEFVAEVADAIRVDAEAEVDQDVEAARAAHDAEERSDFEEMAMDAEDVAEAAEAVELEAVAEVAADLEAAAVAEEVAEAAAEVRQEAEDELADAVETAVDAELVAEAAAEAEAEAEAVIEELKPDPAE